MNGLNYLILLGAFVFISFMIRFVMTRDCDNQR